MNNLCAIGELAAILGVSINTLRRWDKSGKLSSACRTVGGHRRYDVQGARCALGLEVSASKRVVCYARVSSHDQKEQLQTQAQRLIQHCKSQCYERVEALTDRGSGMNYRKPELARLLKLLLQGEGSRLVLVTKDRLLRFGSELIFGLCKLLGTEIEVLDEMAGVSREQQLTADLVEILTVFSSRLYGSRSRKNLKAVANKPAYFKKSSYNHSLLLINSPVVRFSPLILREYPSVA